MHRWIILGLLLVSLTSVAGCFTFDSKHNRHHWGIVRKDLQIIHEDLDSIFGLDRPSRLSRTEY